jgi:hypothetical protein
MRNKYLNLLFGERDFNLKLLGAVLLAGLSLFSITSCADKRLEAERLQQDKVRVQELEGRVLQLEAKLKSLEGSLQLDSQLKQKADFALKGIISKGDTSAAIINDEVYQVGDAVSGYTILNISANTVTFQDPATGEQITIRLPEHN